MDPLSKLIEVTYNVLGITLNNFFKLDTSKMERVGKKEIELESLRIVELAKAESKADIIRCKGNLELEKIINEKKLNQETKRLKNIGDTLIGTKHILESGDNSNISEDPVDKDWGTRFFDTVQDISDEEMKKLWSKILAGEIKQPGSYSLRTLEILKNLNKKEAEAFIKVSRFVSDKCNIVTKGEYSFFLKENIQFDDFSILQEIGLISSARDTALIYNKGQIYCIKFNNVLINFTIINNDINIPVISLTNSGKELASLIKNNVDEKYLQDLITYLKILPSIDKVQLFYNKF